MTTGLVVRGESGRPAPLFPLFLCLVLAACATVQPELPSGRAPRPAEVRPSTFRSALDGRPRMLTTDLGGDLWVAYDTGNAALYKVWPGGVVLEGAVYDYRHGPQPRAIGPAWVLRSGRNPWRLRKAGESIRPEVQYRGHREEEGAIVILAELRHEDLVIPVEERVRRSPDPVPSVEWRFRTSGVPADVMVEVLVELDSLQAMPETDGRWRDRREGTDEALRASLVLTSNAETTMLVRFADPVVSAVASPEVDAVWEAMAATGCPSCHATEAQTVGPSLLAIAERYDDDSRTIDRLAQEVRHGSQGVWGEKAMPAQDFVSLAQARDFVAFILALDAEGAEDANDAHAQRAAAELRTNREPTQWEMAVEFGPGFVSNWIAESIVELVEPEPEASGDGAPVPGVHPSFDLEEIRLEEFQPKVGGMDFFSNGDLVIASWDEVGAVYRVSGLQGNDPRDIRVKRIAWGLAEPLGLRVVDDRIYVLQKHELTELIDHDRDGDTDEYRTVSNDWEVSGNFHEFAFGLVADEEGFLITLASSVMPGGYSAPSQPVDRGAVLRIAPDGRAHRVARGLRTPNGIGAGVDGEIFVADNQGCWLPASKIVHLQPDAFYGFRDVDPEADAALVETPPVVWLPQDEIGNSPTEPVALNAGPYQGQMIHGDVTHGGIKRVFVEQVDGAYQGAVFRFSQGLEAGVNRLRWGPDGKLYVGGIGNPGNWHHAGTRWFGLQRLQYNGSSTFEMLAVRAQPRGFEIELTEPLAAGGGQKGSLVDVRQWRYQPDERYGGPKIDLETLDVESVEISEDRRWIRLTTPGLRTGSVVHLRLDPEIVRSERGNRLWTTEAWYTLNRLPKS